MATGKGPANTFRVGGIKLTAWLNTQTFKRNGKDTEVDIVSFNLVRSYKDKEGNWKDTTSFKTTDLPKIRFLVDKGYEWAILGGAKESDDDGQ